MRMGSATNAAAADTAMRMPPNTITGAETDGKEPMGKAMAILSTMVGALTLSHVFNDPGLSGCGSPTG